MYRSRRAEVAWAKHKRPDISCVANRAAELTKGEKEEVTNAHIQILNSAIKRMEPATEIDLQYKALDGHSLQVHMIHMHLLVTKMTSRRNLGIVCYFATS